MIELTVKLPELQDWFEYTGEIREVKSGEYFLPLPRTGVDRWDHNFPSSYCYPIVRKKRWRPELGQRFYYVNAVGKTLSSVWEASQIDQELYAEGNCFSKESYASAASLMIRETLLEYQRGLTE